jgi:acetylglutamate kinase
MHKPLLYIIKVGGNLIDQPARLQSFLTHLAALTNQAAKQHTYQFILIHGGGKLATDLSEKLGITPQLVEGRRITDTETLKIVTMVYAGYINKTIVAQLQSLHCNALGLTGADGNLIRAHKRNHPTIDYGWVGDIDTVQTTLLQQLLAQGYVPVLAPITHNQQGQLLNTNADTLAQQIAVQLSTHYTTRLLFTFEKEGVLEDPNQETSVLPTIHAAQYEALKKTGQISAGMIPKLDNAFQALNAGVQQVIIGKAEKLPALLEGKAGTTLTVAHES